MFQSIPLKAENMKMLFHVTMTRFLDMKVDNDSSDMAQVYTIVVSNSL